MKTYRIRGAGVETLHAPRLAVTGDKSAVRSSMAAGRNALRLLLCGAVLVVVAACGHKAVKQDQPVALEAVPEAAMKAAEKAGKEKFPDLKFHSATLRPNGVYEITGKSKSGKVHDVEVKADGEVVEVE